MKRVSGIIILASAALAAFLPGTSSAQNSRLCPGLTGAARTNCLQAESRRTQREAEVANRRSRILNGLHGAACVGERGVNAGVVGVGGAVGGVPGAAASEGAYAAGRAVGLARRGGDGCR